MDNVTDWAVRRFEARYGSPLPGVGAGDTPLPAREGSGVGASASEPADPSSGSADAEARLSPRTHPSVPSLAGRGGDDPRDAIFAYCYAALHDPVYRETYALNLKREFPRVPLHDDFARWADWGRRLLDLHIGYEAVEPHPLTRTDSPSPKRAAGVAPKPKLKSLPEQGRVVVDEDTVLTDIPVRAWDYRLGNRSAIDWVLDQHKEKRIRDDTVRERFNTYRFAEHKEAMIDLLAKVVTVSLETVAITDAMRALREAGG